ncbi:unnamed protein product [Pleuronectes platessa]|uniref:Uncharacterized protein n=1 Tax=Pleuronectes platessa TaxID=8262 RepID=A0A9N7VEP2_PLEPL|nr:unnamed protein product [Pleuronectes platessa]
MRMVRRSTGWRSRGCFPLGAGWTITSHYVGLELLQVFDCCWSGKLPWALWAVVLSFPPRTERQCGGLGHSAVVRPCIERRVIAPLIFNYGARHPHLEQARLGMSFSPLGWTPGWAVYGGGWALPPGGVNGPSRGTVSSLIHQRLMTE